MTHVLNTVQTHEPTLSTDDIRIFDDILPADVFARLRRYINGLSFRGIHADGQKKAWRVGDGDPLVGPHFGPAPAGAPVADESSMVRLWSEIENRGRGGGPVAEFQGLAASPWVYPDGTGLGPHTDNQPGYAGSCAYYLHEDWHVTQGGLLVVFDPATATKHGDEPELPWVDGEELERDRLNSPGHGIVILPKPNRLVLLSARAQHMITTVTRGPRVSIAGFFHRP